MSKKINKNAIDLLKELSKERNWHDSTFDKDTSYNIKKAANNGTLSYQYACEILEKIGYKKVKEETWQLTS